MLSVSRFLSAAALTLASASSFAVTTVYTSSATFLAQVASGAYTETFTGLASDPPTSFSGGGFSYTASSPSGLYSNGDFLGVNQANNALTLTFGGGNVTALGGNFFATNLSDLFQAVTMTLTLSTGTTVSFTPATFGASYRGFTSDVAITSLVIGSSGVSLYSGLDNLTVGRMTVAVPAIPEPTTWALMGLGLAGIVVARRRQA